MSTNDMLTALIIFIACIAGLALLVEGIRSLGHPLPTEKPVIMRQGRKGDPQIRG